ncbi:hypothetical protein PZ938_05380 [Luteipulveratus sp. YIM 133132]|uniref:hypothetical protein n=1 Tax=Luteipulveratus flavus TaxID=3031728 RepID=UPI0023B0B87F|nr:hypothetical protein [Luteipulveratus sp. YIM 133132]MDE9365032.1 hypothetical protein [Luteipulveratus sp. YIM 133132]
MTAAPTDRSDLGRTTGRTIDIVATVLLVLLQLAGSFFLGFWALFFSLASDGCMGGGCEEHGIEFGVLLALATNLAGLLLSGVGITRGVRWYRLMWPWPVLGMLLLVSGFWVGAQVVEAAVP